MRSNTQPKSHPKLSASGELTGGQANSADTASATDSVALAATGGKPGNANIATTSSSSVSPPSSSSPSSRAGRKVDAAASGVENAGRELAPPPSPPRSARLGKGRSQGKLKGICARPPWSKQGAVARLVYEKTNGRAPANKDQSGGGDKAGNDPSGGGGGGGAGNSGSGNSDGGNSDNRSGEPGIVLSSGGEGGSGDTSRGESCCEEDGRESGGGGGGSPTLKECSFWVACGSGDKVYLVATHFFISSLLS